MPLKVTKPWCERFLLSSLIIFFLIIGTKKGIASPCPQMDDDSHFKKVYESDTARVFTLELARLESTISHCHKRPFFYVVTSDSRTSDTEEGHAALSHDWYPGAARFVPRAKQHTIRNETATVHRQVIVEILSTVEYNALTQNYDTDEFRADLGSAKQTWSTSVEHGPMSAVKTQLGPGDKLDLNPRTRLLIALTDLDLDVGDKNLRLKKHEVEVLSSDTALVLSNTTRFPVKFITVAF